jgi:hypothetical protein
MLEDYVCRDAGRVTVRSVFERFSRVAVQAVALAQEEARLFGHNSVGTEVRRHIGGGARVEEAALGDGVSPPTPSRWVDLDEEVR